MANTLDNLRRLKRDLIYTIDDFTRILSDNFSAQSPIVNKKEIRVVGLKRSGNHAIINWMLQQEKGNVKHLNNIFPGKNPYRFLAEHYSDPQLHQDARGKFSPKDCLIYSYENCRLSKAIDPEIEQKHDIYLGKSAERYDVVILRDPFNMLASMVKRHSQQLKKKNKIKRNYFKIKGEKGAIDISIVDLWISYAKEYLGETQFLSQTKVPINYNSWFLSVDYRKEIAEQLKLEFSDRGFDTVRKNGTGSSFDGLNFDGQAAKMDVLNRWKTVADDINYRALFNNPEIFEYSERIFGHIPGTEALRSE
ncbi:MAG: hypothetical protein SW833_19350 [Cyanobacteriota bacterium]|nr:hypothetical protein [Cyanobacteriota bacterium]